MGNPETPSTLITHTQDIGRRQTKHKNTTHYRNIKILATRIPPQNGDE